QQRNPKRGLADLTPATCDHAEPRGRIHHLCDRTHWTSLFSDLARRRVCSIRAPWSLIYRRNPNHGQRAKTPRAAISASSNDFVATKELSDFLLRCIGCVRVVH